MRLPLRFFAAGAATAPRSVRTPRSAVCSCNDGLVSGAVPHDHVTGKRGEVPALSWAATAIGKPALVSAAIHLFGGE
jgi:hypothetical protein